MSDLIQKLMEIEQAAAAITETAGEKKKEMLQQHGKRMENLAKQVHDESEAQRLEKKQQLEAEIEEELRSQKEQLELKIREMEENYEKNHTRIAQALLDRIAAV